MAGYKPKTTSKGLTTATNELAGIKYVDPVAEKNAWTKAQTDYNNYTSAAGRKAALNGFLNGQYDNITNDVNKLFANIMANDKFSYDPQTDQLFQMYKQQYNAQGTRAMQNQMGVATAMTGGYNSSAAQTSAQSTFQGYMDELSNKAAETYQSALDMWKYNKQNTIDKYNIGRDMLNSAENAYYQNVGVKQNALNTAYDIFNGQRNFNFGQYQQSISNANAKIANEVSLLNNANQIGLDNYWKNKDYSLQKKIYKGR